MVKNATTFDSLKKTLHEKFKEIGNVKDFFKYYYGENLRKASENFCSSLAAYSLICYFM